MALFLSSRFREYYSKIRYIFKKSKLYIYIMYFSKEKEIISPLQYFKKSIILKKQIFWIEFAESYVSF